MQEVAWTEWLNSPETAALVRYLRRRKAPVAEAFLTGEAIPPLRQGRAAGYHELEIILTKPAAEVREILGGK